ncbi:hypothetical protein TNCV_4884401 [Trichonephila clavipes]|nr:hypothetical protein TNCV_4884401 [Trichonephila clavipes]
MYPVRLRQKKEDQTTRNSDLDNIDWLEPVGKTKNYGDMVLSLKRPRGSSLLRVRLTWYWAQTSSNSCQGQPRSDTLTTRLPQPQSKGEKDRSVEQQREDFAARRCFRAQCTLCEIDLVGQTYYCRRTQ